MAKVVVMPKLGLTMTEGTVSQWLKKVGDEVKEGEPFFEVETDKLTNTIEASASGVVRHFFVEAGTTVPVLAKVAIIAAADVDISALIADAAPAAAAAAPAAEEKGSVLVIGGGPGGYVAAIRAAQLGAKVTIVEKDALGGTCLNRGCMPTKAMLHSSEIYEAATSSENIGISCDNVKVDWEKVQGFRASVVEKLTSGVKALLRLNKVTSVSGEAVFTGPKTVKVGDKELSAEKVIICSGSYPIIPGIPGLKESKAVIDSTACLSLDHIPESMVVIGGGVIGLELGSVYRRYGTKVTVVEMQPRLLPLMDGELTMLAEAKLRSEGLEILTSTSVVAVEDTDKGAKVKVKGPDGEKAIDAEKILVCVGRGPNTAGLGLDKAGITVKDGFIQTNEKQETNVPGVYAVGDCTGKLMLAHAAMAMGVNAVCAMRRVPAKRDLSLIPSGVYVSPEIASAGMSEKEAAEKGIEACTAKANTMANARSLIASGERGFIKVTAEKGTGRLLGAVMYCERATDLIQEAAAAIAAGMTVSQLLSLIHGHPTFSEIFVSALEAAEKKI